METRPHTGRGVVSRPWTRGSATVSGDTIGGPGFRARPPFLSSSKMMNGWLWWLMF